MKKRFKTAYIELTNVCNRRCSFCHGTRRPPKFMDPDLFTRLAQELAPLTEMVYFHVMGEALLHPDFRKICHAAREFGLSVGLTTNGTLFGTENALCLLEPPFCQLNISLHSGVTKETLQEILIFTERAVDSNPFLYINYRLWDVCDTNDDYLRMLSEHFQKPLFPNRAIGRHGTQIRDRFYIHIDEAFSWPDLSLPRGDSLGFCHGGIDQFCVLSDGRVTGCCLDSEGDLCFGSYPEQSLDKILYSSGFERMRNMFHRGQVSEELCYHCSYRNRFRSRAELLYSNYLVNCKRKRTKT